MTVTRLRHAPAALALVLAALALGWAGGILPGALDRGTQTQTRATAGPGSWTRASVPEQPAVTVGGDERVDGRADRWRERGLVALLAAALAAPPLGSRVARAKRSEPRRSTARWATVPARAPPGQALPTGALAPT